MHITSHHIASHRIVLYCIASHALTFLSECFLEIICRGISCKCQYSHLLTRTRVDTYSEIVGHDARGGNCMCMCMACAWHVHVITNDATQHMRLLQYRLAHAEVECRQDMT